MPVHVRKPDAEIFRLAPDIAQVPARRVVFIENTPMFVQVAEGLGIRSIFHADYSSTCAQLASFGLQDDEAAVNDRLAQASLDHGASPGIKISAAAVAFPRFAKGELNCEDENSFS